jgi:hypothetical protein
VSAGSKNATDGNAFAPALETAEWPSTPDAGTTAAPFAVASHDALFRVESATTCDACGAPCPEDRGEAKGYGVPGHGLYMWLRGDDLCFEHAPLCASCASAIGMTALARWEIEEEEG